MKRSAIEAALILVGVFGAGGVVGGAASRLWLTPAAAEASARPCGGRSPDELVALFRHRLALDDGQAAAVEPALRRGWAEVARAYEAAEPAVEEVRQRTRAVIRAVLRPEQEVRFAELTAELDAQRAIKRRCRQDGIAAAGRLAAPEAR
jgi:hypothetical protein